MEWYKKALLGAGLLGLSSLAGCIDEPVKPEPVRFEPVQSGNTKDETYKIEPKDTNNETNLELSDDGLQVRGTFKDMDINYSLFVSSYSPKEVVWLGLEKNDINMFIIDGLKRDKEWLIDGNVNYFLMYGPHLSKNVFYEDNGDFVYLKDFTEKEAIKLREWCNVKLKEIYETCKERFGDKFKIPYKKEQVEKEEEKKQEKSLDDILEEFGS